ncbi:MAG: MopE-related protein [Myxococcota bacterium]|nr:MopE-related protein [Myxococcota bacterium]
MRIYLPLKITLMLLSFALMLSGCADIGAAYPDAESAGDEAPSAADDGGSTDQSSVDTTDQADASDDGDASDGDDGTDAEDSDDSVDGTDTVVTTDATDSSDATAGMSQSDAAEGSTDTADMSDGSDSTDQLDSLDAEDTTDGTDPPGDECIPCRLDADCDAGECVDYGAQGSYCGQACEAFQCTEQSDGAATDCYYQNSFGTCDGVVFCLGTELTDCTAATPSEDICDGIDNDCDGDTDETWQDADSDGMADCVDNDDDGDGVLDTNDNCPLISNAMQSDLDLDDIGDACDPDDDGDGVVDENDCAPTDPNLSVGSAEVCNGQDDDCDGITDEADALGCSYYWPDNDGDGFGGDGLELCLCQPTDEHFKTDGGDCDDSMKFISPLAPETCDTKDNDCDSETDEENAIGCSVYYYDEDGDGYYADGADSKCLCAFGLVEDFTGVFPGDCNDTTPLVNPTAQESCDGTDENCNLQVDDGCDDDQDGFCDADLPFLATGTITCPFGGGDCNDEVFAIKPGAIEACDGFDTNCSPSDDKAEGTAEACGAACEPCPVAPDGASYSCTGLGAAGQCILSCQGGFFCEDCTCDGNTIHQLGSAVSDAKLIYDSYLDTFRIGYASGGTFRLRAVSKTGGLGNDVVSVAGVTKWTDWGLAQNPANGQFVFAWTAYPESSIRVGIASNNGTTVNQYLVAPDLAGALARRNVQLGYHASSQTFLAVWDEGTGIDIDVRGLLLESNAAPSGSAFGVVGGNGNQVSPKMTQRGTTGYALSWANEGGTVGYRLMDHTAGNATAYTLGSVKSGTSPQLWYGPGLDRGILQWLGTDDQYHIRLVTPAGPTGPEIPLGSPAGGVSAAPSQNAFYLVFTSGGQVRSRRVDSTSAAFLDTVQTLSAAQTVTKIVGSVTHPLGYSLTVWVEDTGLKGRLLAP